MTSPFAAVKTGARRAVHKQFAVTAVYSDTVNKLYGFTARWHDKLMAQVGDLENAGYAQIFEGVDTLVFTTDEVSVCGFPLVRNATVTLPDFQMTLQLDTLYPPNGPINVTWAVTRLPYDPTQAVAAAGNPPPVRGAVGALQQGVTGI